MADNLLDKASILLTPTAYDNGRMLSVKPNENLYGSELVTNGDFSNGSANWTLGTGMSIINEELHITNNSTNDRVYQNIGLVQGKIYQVSFDVLSFSGTSFQILMGGTSTPDIGAINSTGSYTFTQECLGSNGFFYFMSTLSNVVIDNVSVVEDLSGDFQFSRSSAATRVNAQGLVENVQIISPELVSNGNFSQIGTEEVLNGNFSQEGSELIVNGDFATDSDWTLSSGSSIENGKLTIDALDGTYQYARQILSTTIGSTYKLEFDITEINNVGQVQLMYNNVAIGGTLYTSIGTHTLYFKSTNSSGTLEIKRRHPSNTNVSIDNVSVKEVGQNWTLGTDITIENEKAFFNNSAYPQAIEQTNVATIGKQYKVSFTVSDYQSGTVKLRHPFEVSGVQANGDYVFYGEAASTGITLRGDGVPNNFKIDNISVKEVGQDWSVYTSGTSTVTFEEGAVLNIDGSNSNLGVYQENVFSNGTNYKIVVNMKATASFNAEIVESQSAATVNIIGNVSLTTSYQEFTFYHQGTGTNDLFIHRLSSASGSNQKIYIKSASVKEITDDTDLPRINYEGFSYQDSLGSELIVNGDFSVDSNWTKGAGWSISGGTANTDGTPSSEIRQNNVTSVGKQYKYSFTISNSGSGVFSARFRNKSTGTPILNFSNEGTYNGTFTSTGTFIDFVTLSDNTASFSIDNISVKEYLGQEVVPDSGCGSWLLEGQSTNLITYSEDFSQWSNGESVVVANQLTSPSGEMTASKINALNATNQQYINLNSTVSSGSEYTFSCFAKKGEIDYIALVGLNPFTVSYFDLDNGTVLHNTATSSSIEDFGNGWYKCTSTFDADTTTKFSGIYLSYDGVSITNGTNISNGEGVYIWGAQLEQQSYATSYIPTSGATNTRLQDIATNSGNSTLINSTEGVLYAEISLLSPATSSTIISLSDGGANRLYFEFFTSNRLYAIIENGSSTFSTVQTITQTNNNKLAFKYSASGCKLYINGTGYSFGGLSFSSETLDTLNFASSNGTSSPFYGKTKALAVYKEALTDAELQSLTTI